MKLKKEDGMCGNRDGTQIVGHRISVPQVLKLKRYVAYIILSVENYKWREEGTYDKLTSFHKETM